MLLSLSSLRYI